MTRLILFLLKAYKKYLSPLLVNTFGHSCRFTPTCSQYAYQAIEKRGLIKGTYLALVRVLKCNPLIKGGFDPVPKSV